MTISPQPYDTWEFSGDEETYSTLAAGDAADGGSYDGKDLTTLPATDHGFKAGSLVYIQGTTNYNGMKLIQAVAANTITIYASYIAETFTTGDTIKTLVTYDRITGKYSDAGVTIAKGAPYEFMGFDFTLDSACGTVENFQCTINANKGSAWDNLIYTKAMNGIQYINYFFNEPKKLESGDQIDFTFANTDDNLWGLKVYTRRLI